MFYPYNSELQKASETFDMGNFSLWFNKLIPLDNENKCKPCDQKGNDKEAVQYYKSKYDSIKRNSTLKKMLEKKHSDQKHFCEKYEEAGYEIVVFPAELKSPLITGIGQPHPNEIGMVFDHTIGIPYIPSSSIKGIVRFAHTLGLIGSNHIDDFIKSDEHGEKYIDEMNKKTLIPDFFGGDLEKEKNGKKEVERRKGKVIFLDVYPKKVPDLHVDIMNPHYGAYYGDENGATPPADHLDPTPIKFLTVKPGTTFIFRALVPKNLDLKDHVIKAYERALSVEGVGAKTAVGYGRFSLEGYKTPIAYKSKTGSKTDGTTDFLFESDLTDQEIPVKREVWENAHLTWSPGNQLITASWHEKRATITGKGLVPDSLHKKLFGKKKSVATSVEVEPVGNAFKIVKIEPLP